MFTSFKFYHVNEDTRKPPKNIFCSFCSSLELFHHSENNNLKSSSAVKVADEMKRNTLIHDVNPSQLSGASHRSSEDLDVVARSIIECAARHGNASRYNETLYLLPRYYATKILYKDN